MKKLFLLFSAGAFACAANAQVNMAGSVVRQENDLMSNRAPIESSKVHGASSAHKTTAASSRWYNYANYVDTVSKLNGLTTQLTALSIWQDTIQNGQYTSGLQHINMVSVGTIIDPSSAAFNDSTLYLGDMKLSNADAFTVDSVAIWGVYGFNPAKSAIADTLILSFVKGFGTPSSDIITGQLAAGGHYPSATFPDMRYDSVLNVARSASTPIGTIGSGVMKIVLDNSTATPAWGDTTANGLWVRTIALPTPMSAAAASKLGVSISFKSGDPALPTSLPGDTLFYNTGGYKYNMFRPLVAYVADPTSGAVQWANHDVADTNVGLFKKLPNYANGWTGVYLPTWAWSSSSGASALQFPYVDWHIACATCGVIQDHSGVAGVALFNNISAQPNPANDELAVTYSLVENADLTVSLTSMLGQVVAVRDLKNVKSGKAVFNTATLTPGIYFYSVNAANGARTTGRVVVAH
jgi:hypothetical protein